MLQGWCTCRTPLRLSTAVAVVVCLGLVLIVYNSSSFGTTVLQWGEFVLPTTMFKEERQSALRRCLNGVVTVVPGGRFGNAFMEVASAWAVARTHNLTLATPTALRDTLLRAFRRVPLGLSIEELLAACPADAPTASARAAGWRGIVLSEADVFDLQVNTADITAVATAIASALAADPAAVPGPLVLSEYVVLSEYIMPLADELRTEMEWQDGLREKAVEKLRYFGETTANILGEPAETVIFVGVHVRRTDYRRWLRERAKTYLEADASYYKRAVALLRRDLDDQVAKDAGGRGGSGGGAAGPLALVLVSDDMSWVREILLPELNALAQTLGRMAVFAGGGGDESSALQDLALLSVCNHTVFAYGTYGMTAALLSGGRVVAFELHKSYPISQAASLDPQWSLLR